MSTVEVPLRSLRHVGVVAVIDAADADLVAGYDWRLVEGKRSWYAVATVTDDAGANHFLRMHRLILGVTDPRIEVDHKNHIGLDNRRENLRPVTKQQNIQNRRPNRNGSCRYRGVGWHKHCKSWRARIRVDEKQVHLGYFDTEAEAARAYDAAARIHYGEFAYLNFPIEQAA